MSNSSKIPYGTMLKSMSDIHNITVYKSRIKDCEEELAKWKDLLAKAEEHNVNL